MHDLFSMDDAPPKKYALRTNAPKFCGSTTSSKTSQSFGPSFTEGNLLIVSNSVAWHEKYGLICVYEVYGLGNYILMDDANITNIM